MRHVARIFLETRHIISDSDEYWLNMHVENKEEGGVIFLCDLLCATGRHVLTRGESAIFAEAEAWRLIQQEAL